MFFDGFWYRGPIYYRWTHGHRVFWLNGGWREDNWRGPRPSGIAWDNRGGPLRGFKPGIDVHGGVVSHPHNGPWLGGHGEPASRGEPAGRGEPAAHGDFGGHAGSASHPYSGGGSGHH